MALRGLVPAEPGPLGLRTFTKFDVRPRMRGQQAVDVSRHFIPISSIHYGRKASPN